MPTSLPLDEIHWPTTAIDAPDTHELDQTVDVDVLGEVREDDLGGVEREG